VAYALDSSIIEKQRRWRVCGFKDRFEAALWSKRFASFSQAPRKKTRYGSDSARDVVVGVRLAKEHLNVTDWQFLRLRLFVTGGRKNWSSTSC